MPAPNISPEPAPTAASTGPLSRWGTEGSLAIVYMDFKVMDDGKAYDLWAVSSAGGEPIKILEAVNDFRLIPG